LQYFGDFNFLKIGERVSFGGIKIFLNAPVSIGNDTMIGFNTIIHTSTHDYNNYPMWLERIDRPVIIGNNVWIGFNVSILPGIKIGDNSVVGAGSVVTKNVPPNVIIAGNPAKIIKTIDINLRKQESEIERHGIIKKEDILSKSL
jgi:maltose O-acetyltransferase